MSSTSRPVHGTLSLTSSQRDVTFASSPVPLFGLDPSALASPWMLEVAPLAEEGGAALVLDGAATGTGLGAPDADDEGAALAVEPTGMGSIGPAAGAEADALGDAALVPSTV